MHNGLKRVITLREAAEKTIEDWEAHCRNYPPNPTKLNKCLPYGAAIIWESLYDLKRALKEE